MSPEKSPTASTLQLLLGLGSVWGVSVGVGVFAGVFADRHFGTSPLLALLGIVLGIVCAAVASYQVIRPYLKG